MWAKKNTTKKIMKATEEKHKLDLENLRAEMAKQLWEMEGKKKECWQGSGTT